MNETTMFPSTTTPDVLLDEYDRTSGILSYGGCWVCYKLSTNGKAASAVYSYDGRGGLDKMLEVSGGIDTGSAIKVALDTIDNIKEMED